MANLDARLVQLFDTLISVGASWMIVELVEGVEAGVVTLETADALADARILARQERELARKAERIDAYSVSRPLEGDEQIVWAARYVYARLDSSLEMMSVSEERLNNVIASQDEARAKGIQSKVRLGLIDQEAVVAVAAEQTAAAQSGMGRLKKALEAWVVKATEGRQAL